MFSCKEKWNPLRPPPPPSSHIIFQQKAQGQARCQCSLRRVYVTPKTVETIALAHGCPPELNIEILLLTSSYPLSLDLEKSSWYSPGSLLPDACSSSIGRYYVSHQEENVFNSPIQLQILQTTIQISWIRYVQQWNLGTNMSRVFKLCFIALLLQK